MWENENKDINQENNSQNNIETNELQNTTKKETWPSINFDNQDTYSSKNTQPIEQKDKIKDSTINQEQNQIDDDTITEDFSSKVIPAEKIGDTTSIKQAIESDNFAKKMTWVVYAIIFISILIWLYFYIHQNKKVRDDNPTIETITWVEDSSNTLSWTENINSLDTDSWTKDIETIDLWDSETWTKNEKDPNFSTSWSSSISWSWKSEQAIMDDFEKELDSLFDMVDENEKSTK